MQRDSRLIDRTEEPRPEMISSNMVRLSVMYPATPGSTFNWDYYLGQHRELSRRLLSGRGLVRTEIDRGVAGIPPGPPPYHAVGHLFFRTMAELESALQATAAEFVADEQKYASVPSVVQISVVVE
jgi:uncharacterized protein (TIGR02118 family)